MNLKNFRKKSAKLLEQLKTFIFIFQNYTIENISHRFLSRFKTEKTGFFRLDVNNKIFASKREKKR